MRKFSLLNIFILAFVAYILGASGVVAQNLTGDWTANSGAMHYKAGNIKYEAPNSPSGVWTLQLVDGNNTPVAPPVEFAFDTASPAWYFLIYERQ